MFFVSTARHIVSLFLIAMFSAVLSNPPSAQIPSQTVELRGRVLDPNGAAIYGAEVLVTAGDLPPITTVSDSNGNFTLALHSGRYQLRTMAEGFAEKSEKVVIDGNVAKRIELVLSVAASSATVTIPDTLGYGVANINSPTSNPTPLREI